MQLRGEALRPLQGRTGPLERPAIQRFIDKREPRDSGCIEWVGGKTLGGYGVFAADPRRNSGRKEMAHRWAYEHYVGPIPDGYDIDHLCRNRACVNVEHLEPVTRAENIRRAYAAKTHCVAGHLLDEANTYTKPGTAQRRCKTCRRERDRARRLRRNPTMRGVA